MMSMNTYYDNNTRMGVYGDVYVYIDICYLTDTINTLKTFKDINAIYFNNNTKKVEIWASNYYTIKIVKNILLDDLRKWFFINYIGKRGTF